MNLTKSINHKVGIALVLLFGFLQNGIAQEYNSLVGARVGYKTAEFSAKIALDKYNYLEGTVGVVTPQPEYTVGAGAAYHRHIHLNEKQTIQMYYGAGLKGVFGDVSSIGVGPQLGLIFLYKKVNIGLDVLPTYFFNDELGFRPLFGIHLRYVNY